jgi:hypothetical protein
VKGSDKQFRRSPGAIDVVSGHITAVGTKKSRASGLNYAGMRSGGEAVAARSADVRTNGVTLRMPPRSLHSPRSNFYSSPGMICIGRWRIRRTASHCFHTKRIVIGNGSVISGEGAPVLNSQPTNTSAAKLPVIRQETGRGKDAYFPSSRLPRGFTVSRACCSDRVPDAFFVPCVRCLFFFPLSLFPTCV